MPRWVAGFALPIAVVTVLFAMLDFGTTWAEVLSWKFVRVVVVTLIVAVVAGYFVGRTAPTDSLDRDKREGTGP